MTARIARVCLHPISLSVSAEGPYPPRGSRARGLAALLLVRDGKFLVVKDGEGPRDLAVLRRGEFTGDVAHLTGGPSLVSAVARGDCEIYDVSSEGVREILNRFPDLVDVILQAFIARRQLLRESATFTGPRVIDSRYSPDTLRIRDFLGKNRLPFTWLDLEADPRWTSCSDSSG